MSTIGEVYDPNKQQTLWYNAGNDKGTKLLDKTEDKVTGDKYDYADTTKTGVDDARLQRNVIEFAKTVGFSVAPKLTSGATKNGLLLAKCYVKAEELVEKVRAGKMSKADAAGEMATFIAKEQIAKAAGIASASLSLTMLSAISKAVTFTIDDQKADEQLHHDEAMRLHVAETLKNDIPAETYAEADSGMSTFGQTHRKTDTFAAVQSAYDKALKENPSIDKAMRERLWHGKAAVLDLGIKDKATLAKVLDPNNKDPKAVAFREMWNNTSNVAFRLGVNAMIDEQRWGSEKTKAMYAADLARFNEEKAARAALDAKAVPVKP